MGTMSLIECIRWSRYGMAIAIVLNKVGVCLDSSYVYSRLDIGLLLISVSGFHVNFLLKGDLFGRF